MKRSHLITATVIVVAALGLVGCSASPSPTSAAGGAPANASSPRVPGVTGTIAAITGSTAQVQGPSSQTAVSWTSTTTFTAQAAATAKDVVVGSCVMARAAASGQGSASAAPGDASAATDAATDAATVEILPQTNGTCGFGAGGNGGPGRTASGAPNPAPSGSAGSFRGGGAGGAFGVVASIDSTGFVVTTSGVSGATGSSRTVTTTANTTYTTLQASTAAAMQVGACASAQGTTDSTGAMTATTIAVSQPQGGTCSTGRVRGGSGSSNSGSSNG